MIDVSVVVATYKRDVDLKRSLESLAVQTFDNMEIVLVNDNRTDDWKNKVTEIVQAFKSRFPSMALTYIINEVNQGSAKTRNIGIFASKGNYITFLDDDDVYLPDKVKNQFEFMEKGNYDYSITDLCLYDENNKPAGKRIRSYIKSFSQESLNEYHLKYHMTGTDTMMFKKEYLEKIGGFAPIDVGDEYYLIQRAIDGDGKFGYLEGCDIKAYIHTGEDGGVSSGEGKIQGENALYEYKKTYFHRINRRTRRYVTMRHYAVLAFAELRRKQYLKFFVNGFKSFFVAPMACLKMLLLNQ